MNAMSSITFLRLWTALALFLTMRSLAQEEDWIERVEPVGSKVPILKEWEVFNLVDFQKKNAGLSAQLDAVNPIVDLAKSSKDFLILFTVFNPTESDKRMLKWQTPLFANKKSHVDGNVFEVRSATGKELEFIGRDMKMAVDPNTGQPPSDAFVTIKKGQSISNRVNIANTYRWEHDGYYYIRVREIDPEVDTFTDVMRTYTKVYLKNVAPHMKRLHNRHTHRDTKSKVLLEMAQQEGASGLAFEGCSADAKVQVQKWVSDAKVKIDAARACTESNSCNKIVDTWFGSSMSQDRFNDLVSQQFKQMAKLISKNVYACNNKAIQENCDKSTFAFVYPSDKSQKIHICEFTFGYKDYSEKVQTIIHEMSHFNHIGGTDDNAYGEKTCKRLASKDPEKAAKTADSVGYFGKYQPGAFCNAPKGYAVGCTDKYKNCNDFKSHCSRNTKSGEKIKDACPVTCNNCKSQDSSSCRSGSSKPDKDKKDGSNKGNEGQNDQKDQSASGCKDKYSNCKELKSNCANGKLTGNGGNVKDACPVTCNNCKSQDSEANESNPADEGKEESQPANEAEVVCKDLKSKCPEWIKSKKYDCSREATQAVCCHSCKKSTKKPAKITKPPIKSDAAHGFGLDNVMTGGVLVAVLIRSHLH